MSYIFGIGIENELFILCCGKGIEYFKTVTAVKELGCLEVLTFTLYILLSNETMVRHLTLTAFTSVAKR